MFVNGIHIRNLKFSNTQLSMLKDNSLQYLRTMLETLAITNSKLNQVSFNRRISHERYFFLLKIYADFLVQATPYNIEHTYSLNFSFIQSLSMSVDYSIHFLVVQYVVCGGEL